MPTSVWTSVASTTRKATAGDISIPISGLAATDCIVAFIGRSVNTTVGAAGISLLLQTTTGSVTVPLITHLGNAAAPIGTVELHVLRVDATQAANAQSLTLRVNATENTVYDIYRVTALGDVDTTKAPAKSYGTASQQFITDTVALGVGAVYADWAIHVGSAVTMNTGLTFVSNQNPTGGDLGPTTIMPSGTTTGGSASTNTGYGGVRSGEQPANGANNQLQGSVGWSANAVGLGIGVVFKPFGVAQALNGTAAGSSTVAANATPVHFNQLNATGKCAGSATATGTMGITPAKGDDPLVAAIVGTATVTAKLRSLDAAGRTALRGSPAGSASLKVLRRGQLGEQAGLPVGQYGWTFSSNGEYPNGTQRVTSGVPTTETDRSNTPLPQEYWKAVRDSPYGHSNLRPDFAGLPPAYDNIRYGIESEDQYADTNRDLTPANYAVADNRFQTDAYLIAVYLDVFTIWTYTLQMGAPPTVPLQTYPLSINWWIEVSATYSAGVRYNVGLRLYEMGGTFDQTVNTDLPGYMFRSGTGPGTKQWQRAYFTNQGQQINNWANMRLEVKVNCTVGFSGQQDQIFLYGFQMWAPLGISRIVEGELVSRGSATVAADLKAAANQKRLAATSDGSTSIAAQARHQLKSRASISTTATVVGSLTRTSPAGAKALAGSPAGVAAVKEIRRVLLAGTSVGVGTLLVKLRLQMLQLRAAAAGSSTPAAQLRESLRLGTSVVSGTTSTTGTMFSGKPAPMYGSPVIGFSTVTGKVTISQGRTTTAPAAFAPSTTKPRATRVPLLGQ